MTPGPGAELDEEGAFLLRSIEDLDAEHDAGDLSESDYRLLRDRYTKRAAVALRARPAVADAGAPPPSARARPRRRTRRRGLVWGALGLFAAAAVVLLVAELATRLPGETGSGSVRLGSAQQVHQALAQAAVLETDGHADQALTLYRQVLRQDPTQEQALAEAGWLEFEAGVAAKSPTLLSQGQRDEQAAEQADPTAYAPHLYLGSMLLVESRPAASADEFARFLAGSPPTAIVEHAWPYVVRAYDGAGRSLPPAPPGVGS